MTRALLATVLAAILIAQTDSVAKPLWSATEGIDSPESVYYDAGSGFVFSSQIVGDASAKDGNGRIVKLTLDGKVVDANWAKGLDAPKGLRAFRGTLYVADIDQVVGFDISSGRETSRVRIADAKFLNDLCTRPDGVIYTTDSFANRVWVVRNGVASLFSDAPQLELPNGILVDGNKVVVATDGRPARGGGGTPGSLFAIDITSKAVTQVTTQPIGTPDGLELDGRGGYVLSDVAGGRIFHVTAGGEVRQLSLVDRQPADISYIPSRKLLLVPHLGLNRISAYDLPF
jgi:sugar lactone lactonase YvrE